MKIKMDFISNSSSTSFVYIAKEMISKESFFEAAGVSADSPIAVLFEGMYHSLRSSIEAGKAIESTNDVDALAEKSSFVPEVLDRVRAAVKQGMPVVAGEFSSEESLAESILCTEIFEIESEGFFLNAYDNYW